jgi:hypothetical protein
MSASVTSGLERFVYEAFPHQLAFHSSPLKHRLLGGAAGPGKTFALIMDHMLNCNRFSVQDAPQVHTLLLRRTHPKLAATVITRFREKIPKELYRDFNEQQHLVTWRNGSTTQFGSMQHEHDVWGWQGQWYKIGYDELTEFTFPQWQNISAWNRCPVSPHATKDGATNPIGIGAGWVESLFVLGKPCVEMDKSQKAKYDKSDYGYFPATYRENPIYANDPNFIANLDSYQAAISNALKEGIWGAAGGYFDGAFDEAVNVYPAESFTPKTYHVKWLGGDWGFEHNFAIHWNSMDDLGITRCYRELVDNHHTPEELGEAIVKNSRDPDGNLEKYELFSFSHDAFAKRHDTNPIAIRIGRVLQSHGLIAPEPSTMDKPGREQILYDKLKARIKVGEVFNDGQGTSEPVLEAALQISDACPNLISTIGKAPRDEKEPEEIAEFLGDDSLASEGYGLYARFGKPHRKPLEVRVNERMANVQMQRIAVGMKPQTDPTVLAIMGRVALSKEKKSEKPVPLITRGRFQRRRIQNF